MKALVQRAGLVLFGLGVAWILLEAFARFTGLGEAPQLGADFDRSPTLFFSQPERQHPWSPSDDEVLAIAVIGDSFTAGSGIQLDDAYPARLERLLNLNADAQPVEVRAYARGGTSTASQVRFLRQAVAERPDLILLGVFLNDTEDHGIGPWRQPLQPRVPTGWKLALLRASRILAWAYQRAEDRRIQRAWMEYMRKLYQPDYNGWKRFNRALKVFANTCRTEGIPLVAFVFPPAGQLGSEYPWEFAHQSIHQALAEHEIPFFDLLETFRGRSGLRLSVLPGVDGHFNEIGNRIAAEAIFAHLLRAGYISASYRPRLATPQPEDYWLRRLRKVKSAIPR